MDAFKILYQGVLANATPPVIYTVPERAATSYTVGGGSVEVVPSAVVEETQTMVTQMMLCNTTGTIQTVDLYLISDSSTAAGAGNQVFDDISVGTNSTEWLKLNWPLASGNTIRASASANDAITMTLLGIEIT